MRYFILLTLFFLSAPAISQSPRPLYQGDTGEIPSDLSIGEERRRAPAPKPVEKAKKPAEEEKAAVPTEPAQAEEDREEESEVKSEGEVLIEVPVTGVVVEKETVIGEPAVITEPPPALPAPAAPVEAPPPTPVQPLPSDIAVVPVTTKPLVASDANPNRDAGSSPADALPVTFDRYEDNTLSSADTVDTFKIYGRSGEGLAVILVPQKSDMQMGIKILGSGGQILTQTQADQPGHMLSFQTTPLEENNILYLQVEDLSLAAGPEMVSQDPRKYSLELRPVVPPPPPVAATPPARTAPLESTPESAEPAPPPAVSPEAKIPDKPRKSRIPEPEQPGGGASLFENPWIFYGAAGLGGLLLILLALMVLRKLGRKKESTEEEGSEEVIEYVEEEEGGEGEEPKPESEESPPKDEP